MGFSGSLIPNGGFETGDFTDWTQQLGTGVPAPVVSNAQAHSGTYSALLGQTTVAPHSGDCAIYQDVAVPAGTHQAVSVWFRPHIDAGGEIYAQIRNTSGSWLEDFFTEEDPSHNDTWQNRTVDVSAYAGTTIRIWISSYQQRGSIEYAYVDDVEIGVYTAPANNDFANATVLAGGVGQLSGQSNILATAESGEPGPTTWSGDTPTGTNTIWYAWTAPSTGYVAMSTLGSTDTTAFGGYNSVIDVWTGASVGALTFVCANDDHEWAVVDLDYSDVSSYVKFACISGTTYYLRVYGWSYLASDQIVINWDNTVTVATSPPPNDSFANATVLSLPGTTTVLGTLVGATQEAGEPDPFTTSGTVWYKIDQPIAFSPLYLDFNGRRFQIYVYQGTTLAGLVLLAEVFETDWAAPPEGGRFPNYFPTSGDPIYLQVSTDDGVVDLANDTSTGGITTDFQFRISQPTPGPPPSFPTPTPGAILLTDPFFASLTNNSSVQWMIWVRTNRFLTLITNFASPHPSFVALHDQTGAVLSHAAVSSGATVDVNFDDLCRLDDHHVLAIIQTNINYPNTGNTLVAIVITVGDDDSLTVGPQSAALNGSSTVLYGNSFGPSLAVLSPTRAVISWLETTGSFNHHVGLLAISGTTVTTLGQVTTGGELNNNGLLALDATHAVAFMDLPGYTRAYSVVSVSGDVISATSAVAVPFDDATHDWLPGQWLDLTQVASATTFDPDPKVFEIRVVDYSTMTAGTIDTVLSLLPNSADWTDPANNLAAIEVRTPFTVSNPFAPGAGLMVGSIGTVFQDFVDGADEIDTAYLWPLTISGTDVTASAPTVLGLPTTGQSLNTESDYFDDDVHAFAVDPTTGHALILIWRDIENQSVAPGDTSNTDTSSVRYGMVPYTFTLPSWFGTASGARTRAGSAVGSHIEAPPVTPAVGINPPARWQLWDPVTFEVGTFVLNPLTDGDHLKSHAVPYAQFTPSVPVMTMTQDPVPDGSFTGYVLSKDDWNFFNRWFSKDTWLVLTDDLGRQTWIVFGELKVDRVRTAGNQWFSKYTANFKVVKQATDI